jgi:hypothetical protein
MQIDDYLNSYDFQRFQDEALRENAMNTVDLFIKENVRTVKDLIDHAQLHSIPMVIRAGGYSAFKDMIENQKKKNTKEKNKNFWEFMAALVIENPGPPHSLRNIIQNEPGIRGYLEDEKKASDKKEQKKIRESNKAIVNQVIDKILAVYFEHFNGHYFYMSKLLRNQQGAAK